MLAVSSLSVETFARFDRGFVDNNGKGQERSWSSVSFLNFLVSYHKHQRSQNTTTIIQGPIGKRALVQYLHKIL